jgi:hypothetical protein
MFFWKLTPAGTAPEDPYTALPPAKNRRRSEPPTPLSLDIDRNRRARLSSGVVGGWDLKEEHEGLKSGEEKRGEGTGAVRKEDERRRPRMGRQRSRSAGEVLREHEFVYPGGRGARAGGDAEEEAEERSERLQGVPPNIGTATGIGMGLGRRCSRSAGESMRANPRPRPQPQPYQQQGGRPGFEPVYPVVGV